MAVGDVADMSRALTDSPFQSVVLLTLQESVIAYVLLNWRKLRLRWRAQPKSNQENIASLLSVPEYLVIYIYPCPTDLSPAVQSVPWVA